MALADLTVTSARQDVIDFSAPFLHTTLAAMVPVMNGFMINVVIPQAIFLTHSLLCFVKATQTSEFGSSYQLTGPFSVWTWTSILVALFLTSIFLRFVAWLSPYQKDEITEGTSRLGRHLSWVNGLWVLASSCTLRGSNIHLQVTNYCLIYLKPRPLLQPLFYFRQFLREHWLYPGGYFPYLSLFYTSVLSLIGYPTISIREFLQRMTKGLIFTYLLKIRELTLCSKKQMTQFVLDYGSGSKLTSN